MGSILCCTKGRDADLKMYTLQSYPYTERQALFRKVTRFDWNKRAYRSEENQTDISL